MHFEKSVFLSGYQDSGDYEAGYSQGYDEGFASGYADVYACEEAAAHIGDLCRNLGEAFF